MEKTQTSLNPRIAETNGFKSSMRINWKSIIPDTEPYSLRPKQDNYDVIPQQTRPNIDIQDLINSSLKNKDYKDLALPSIVNQRTIEYQTRNSPYPNNSQQYSIAA